MRGFYVGATALWFQPIAPRRARTQGRICRRPFLLRGAYAGLQHGCIRIGKICDRSQPDISVPERARASWCAGALVRPGGIRL